MRRRRASSSPPAAPPPRVGARICAAAAAFALLGAPIGAAAAPLAAFVAPLSPSSPFSSSSSSSSSSPWPSSSSYPNRRSRRPSASSSLFAPRGIIDRPPRPPPPLRFGRPTRGRDNNAPRFLRQVAEAECRGDPHRRESGREGGAYNSALFGRPAAAMGGSSTRLASQSSPSVATDTTTDNNNEASNSDDKSSKIGVALRVLTRTTVLIAAFLIGFRFGRAPGEREAGVLFAAVDAASRRAAEAVPRLRVVRRPSPASILLSALLAREVWRSIPPWAKSRIERRIMRLRGKKSGAVSAEETEGGSKEDPDDMTSYGNLSMKLQGLLKSVEGKLPPDAKISNNIQAPSLALLQLVGQLREQDPAERDNLYGTSGDVGGPADLDGLPEGFEFADWAYDEDPEGYTLKENLERLGFCLVRHDKTTVPGYVGHYVAIHPGRKLALIGVKGTSTVEDLLTDCCGRAVSHELDGPYVPSGKNVIRCHEGILISARRLADDVQPLVEELFLPSGYRMLITGHSLGAGASALLGIILRSRNPALASDYAGERMKVWAYASPPVLDFDTALQCKPFITTVVNNADIVPRMSLSNLLILLELLRDVDAKLEERGIRSAEDGKVDSIALLRKLGEGSGGEMIMSPREMAQALERAQGRVELRDPDHLFVPGRVVAMYSKWTEEKEAEKAEAEMKKMSKRERKVKSEKSDENNAADEDGQEEEGEDNDDTAVAVAVKQPEEYVRVSDGNMKILRQISLDQRMIVDHLSVAYRRSLRELTTGTGPGGDDGIPLEPGATS